MAESIEELKMKLALYEENGAAHLFYAINRKMNEMASLMNKTNLVNIDMNDKDSKEFDRLFKLLEKSQVISNAAQTIQTFAGITNDEIKDTKTPIFRITPESMAENIGGLAGQKR